MSEQYFLVHKLGLGKEVVSLSLVVTEVSRGGGMRWWRQEVGLQISWKKDPERLLRSTTVQTILATSRATLRQAVNSSTRQGTLTNHHHHHIRFWYLRCCGCPGLRGRQHLATPHTRSPWIPVDSDNNLPCENWEQLKRVVDYDDIGPGSLTWPTLAHDISLMVVPVEYTYWIPFLPKKQSVWNLSMPFCLFN